MDCSLRENVDLPWSPAIERYYDTRESDSVRSIEKLRKNNQNTHDALRWSVRCVGYVSHVSSVHFLLETGPAPLSTLVPQATTVLTKGLPFAVSILPVSYPLDTKDDRHSPTPDNRYQAQAKEQGWRNFRC